MALSSSRKGKAAVEREVEPLASWGVRDTTQNFYGYSPAFFIKNARDGEGNWVSDEKELNIRLISKRLAEMPTEGMGDDRVFSIPCEFDRKSTEGIDVKGRKFYGPYSEHYTWRT